MTDTRISRTRRSVVAQKKPVAATTVLRRRRTGTPAQEKGKDGRIVVLRDREDFFLKMLRYSPAQLNTYRSHDYVHVSDLLGKCARKAALSEKFGLPMPAGHVSDSMGLTFAQGTAMHDYIKDKVAKGHPEKLFGRWGCLCGKTITAPMIRDHVPNIACTDCGRVPDRYHELELFDDEYKIVGSPDITLYLDDLEAYYPVEIKSINPEDWKEIARPKPDHVLQVLFYWWLLRRLGYSVVDQVSILYANKGYVFKSPFKEFSFKPAEIIERLDEYLEEAMALKIAREGGALPARTACSSMSCKEAKECHVSVVCFQH